MNPRKRLRKLSESLELAQSSELNHSMDLTNSTTLINSTDPIDQIFDEQKFDQPSNLTVIPLELELELELELKLKSFHSIILLFILRITMTSYQNYIFCPGNDSKDIIHPYPELEKMIMDYLDPIELCKQILLNKYYHKTIGKHLIYLEFKDFHEKKNSLTISEILSENDAEKLFLKACRYGYINVAKKYQKDKWYRSISEIYTLGFVYSCIGGYMDIAKWLLSIASTKIDIRGNSYLVMECCKAGRFEIIKWLSSINKLELWMIGSNFVTACTYGHLEVAQFIYSSYLDPNNQHSHEFYSDDAFIFACKYGHINVAKWLCTICDDYEFTIIPKSNKRIHRVIYE